MIDSTSLPAVNAAVSKLTDMLISKEDELRRRETSGGTYHDVRKMNALREEIASIQTRLERAERLQERILCQP